MTTAYCAYCGKKKDTDDFISVFKRPYPGASPQQKYYCKDSDCYSLSCNKRKTLKQIQRAITNRRNYSHNRNY